MLELKKKRKETVSITLDDYSLKLLDELSSLSGVSRSQVIRNFLGVFSDIYKDLLELQEDYQKLPMEEQEAISFENYLIQKGYRFLVEGKCKK